MRTRYAVIGDEVQITYPDGEMRSYRTVGHDHGYVYDVTHLPGTLGQQVIDPRCSVGGVTLTGPRRGTDLAMTLRDCLRSARRQARRMDLDETTKL